MGLLKKLKLIIQLFTGRVEGVGAENTIVDLMYFSRKGLFKVHHKFGLGSGSLISSCNMMRMYHIPLKLTA